jgi:hypothetical protein
VLVDGVGFDWEEMNAKGVKKSFKDLTLEFESAGRSSAFKADSLARQPIREN